MDRDTLIPLIEAILLTARGPVEPTAIALATESEATEDEIEAAIGEMKKDWRDTDRGVQIERSGGGWRCVTPARFDHVLRIIDPHCRSEVPSYW